ncbi:putative bifunctional diguanylate cyclase/phosphodiesterase [Noviherbaspirillum massiliense]|uniref:putative bifunctional diguanylate cyclase/phosphodiesterase n=1 Tax=Noviherbaspirillum massiliense TaxID=1465823 RepID=UPI0002DB1CF4|nr:EAL domain-containing protein [Noviherbaspirillum massiliense]
MSYLSGTYESGLVVLSIIVASLAAYAGLELAQRVTLARERAAGLWLAGGAFSMGLGIWSMHFVGMLAFSLPIRISYDILLTLLSLLISVAVSGFALFLVSRPRVGAASLCAGGTLMGLGISAMHYAGMAAMRMQPGIAYDPMLFAASILVAIVVSIAGLWLATTLRKDDSRMALAKKAGSAVLIGLAICAMHYTGMAAANFADGSICTVQGGVDSTWLAVTISLATIGILVITLLLSAADSRLASRTAGLTRSLRHANERLHHLALHDGLTRLPNRTLLEDRIIQAISSAQRSGKPFSVMFLDLDRFKTINDSLGHHYGDKLLQAVAQRLTAILRSEDTVARIGGDEFVVVLREMAEAQAAAHIAEKILTALARPFSIEGQEQNISSSIGISIYPDDGTDLRALMMHADSAMYHAKNMGRNNYQFFTKEMNAAAAMRLEMEKSLRHALENGEFELHYQPKVSTASGEIVAMEALVRWRHPQKGLVSPAEFIPLAEDMGLIIPLGAWVLSTACRQNRQWQLSGLPRLRVAVNLSAVQFRQKDLVEFIAQVLEDTGLEASCLELEVTESTVMQDAEEAALILERLHAKGIHISIDDFGTGYSSLSYLKRFHLDSLKIDRSFVRDISSDPDDAAIVKSVIALAHSLRLRVIAEGVETGEQLAFLRTLGCDEYQGYYRSRPLPAQEFERLLRQSMGLAADTPDSRHIGAPSPA